MSEGSSPGPLGAAALRAAGPARIEGEHFQEQLGRNDITSVVGLQVTHPRENAGRYLPGTSNARGGRSSVGLVTSCKERHGARLAELGVVHVGRNH